MAGGGCNQLLLYIISFLPGRHVAVRMPGCSVQRCSMLCSSPAMSLAAPLADQSACGLLVQLENLICHQAMQAALLSISVAKLSTARDFVLQELPSMSVPRSSCGAAALNGILYCAGGSARDDQAFHSSLEAYVTTAGKWLPRGSMSQARSGLAMSAL